VQANRIQMIRDRENNVEVLNGQGIFYQIINPECLFCSLAFGTMPVTTTVVTIPYCTAVVAHLLVPPKCSGATGGDLLQYLLLQCREFMVGKQTGAEEIYRMSQLKVCPHFWDSYRVYPADCEA